MSTIAIVLASMSIFLTLATIAWNIWAWTATQARIDSRDARAIEREDLKEVRSTLVSMQVDLMSFSFDIESREQPRGDIDSANREAVGFRAVFTGRIATAVKNLRASANAVTNEHIRTKIEEVAAAGSAATVWSGGHQTFLDIRDVLSPTEDATAPHPAFTADFEKLRAVDAEVRETVEEAKAAAYAHVATAQAAIRDCLELVGEQLRRYP